MMLRHLVLMCLIGLAVVTAAGQQEASGHYHKRTSQRDTEQSSSPSPAITNNQATSYYEQKAVDKPHGWRKLVIWPEGVTAWLILFTLGAITWQAWETRKAAEAANRSIEVGKTKERAKMLVEIGALDLYTGFRPQATFTVTNVGETNAAIGLGLGQVSMNETDEMPSEVWMQLLTVRDRILKPDVPATEMLMQTGRWILPR